MMKQTDLPDTLPLFPLPGALLLPRARLPLHIFEPRYLALLEDCMKTPHRLIGMIQPREGPNGEKRLSAIGCAGRLTGFSETEDHRYMITLTGVSRFRLRAEVEGFTPYKRAHIDWQAFARDLGREESDKDFAREPFLALLARYFATRDLGTDWSGIKAADTELLINSLSMLLPFGPEDKQALLEAPSLVTRRETLVTLLEIALHSDGRDETLQ
ncbi:LON peptidase substrate-binding domain-containing protein [Cypionkella sp.]|uniref:LON peptidase substrate-binding domain-containing protein n=1 Tax=Cypionkella sp. TaxID=2811411 RepID=UPI00271C0DAE|nr:LON peptidase substrate-binding domain-containing protein [Cypionkella sp.]MDO8983313.1 LON peptidase substrate-binding domain-containing protein [Cypionkella sp.]MDP2050156.1 LON peptidase substrate-binding domain-containing protein [Cypionkella sp.]